VRSLKRFIAVLGVGLAVGLLAAAPALASSITTPSSNPFTIPEDGTGTPTSFDVQASGFTHGQQVFVEECDGVPSTAPGWSPTIHCDNATSPSAVTADGSGHVDFPKDDPNFGFTPFPAGVSPSGQFNCLYSGEPDPGNGRTSYTNCQLRVSSNNAASTSDQSFITLTYPQPGAVTPETHYAVILPLAGLAIGGAFFLLIRRRRAAQVSAT
jgi:hypothetical protein